MDPTPPFEEILRRAELFSFIANIINLPPTESPSPELVRAHEPPSVPKVEVERAVILPRISIVDRRLICNGASLDLAGRPLMLRLFQTLLATPDMMITRNQLLAKVYRFEKLDTRTARWLQSSHSNAVKMISRARIMATTFLGSGGGRGIEWLVFDMEREAWCLYRLNNRYIAQHSTQDPGGGIPPD